MADLEIAPGRHLLVCSPGGHLVDLLKWSQRLGSRSDSLWVTSQSPQSEFALQDRRTLGVPYVAPRDLRAAFRVLRQVFKEVDWEKERFTCAISTGAALGVAGLTAARTRRVPAIFIESISRLEGPGLSGRLVALDPRVGTYCQWPQWANRRWKFAGSVLEEYEPYTVGRAPVSRPRLFVTLGTIQPYRFDAAVDAVLASGLADQNTIWNLGATSRRHLPGAVRGLMNGPEFTEAAKLADVVVTHAGVGTIISLLEMGIYPVVLPRRRARAEHVDDHQVQIADWLACRGIATVCEAPDLRANDLLLTIGRAIRPSHGQDARPVVGDRDGVLPMRRAGPVGGDDGPFVVQNPGAGGA